MAVRRLPSASLVVAYRPLRSIRRLKLPKIAKKYARCGGASVECYPANRKCYPAMSLCQGVLSSRKLTLPFLMIFINCYYHHTDHTLKYYARFTELFYV